MMCPISFPNEQIIETQPVIVVVESFDWDDEV